MENLLKTHVEWKVIINDINQDINEVLEDKTNTNVKFHRTERSLEEVVVKFKILGSADKISGGSHQKHSMEEDEKPTKF